MRKIAMIFTFCVVLSFIPIKTAHAGGAAAAATAALINLQLIATHAMHVVNQVMNYTQFVNSARDAYQQLQNMIRAEERALRNLRTIVDVRSFSDFMNWQNRQLFLAREVEWHYHRMNVNVGGSTFRMHEISGVPDAMRNTFGDPFAREFTDAEIRDMWIHLGLTPANYVYLQTWQQRNEEIGRRLLTYSDILHEEHEEAQARNQNILNRYNTGDEVDPNRIAMEHHVTAMNTEMAIREQTRIMVEIAEGEMARHRMANTPQSPPQVSLIWDVSPFRSITPDARVFNDSENL